MTKYIAWMIPEMIEGSGGIRTMLAKAEALTERGMVCDYYFYRYPQSMLSDLVAKAERYFQVKGGDFYCGSQLQKKYDLAVATAWDSVKVVRDLNVPHKVQFIQDYEAWFNPLGDAHLWSETSFFFGVKPITLGKWLNRYIEVNFGERPYLCNFGVDKSCYQHYPNTPREDAVCIIFQPEKPRRCVMTAIEALGIVKHHRPQTKIYLYGSKEKPAFWFDLENLGIMTPQELCQLYNRVRVGFCISASNPSRIPFEMMACGLPVVDIYRNNNLYDYPDGSILLAHQAPESIATAILQVLEEPQLANSLSRGGLNFVSDRDLAKEHEDFCQAIEMVLSGVAPKHGMVRNNYQQKAILSPAYANQQVQDFCQKQMTLI